MNTMKGIEVERRVMFGTELITRERNRQIGQEKWTASHDDLHDDQSLAIVAAIYAVAGIEGVEVLRVPQTPEQQNYLFAWPQDWATRFDKRAKHPRLKQLAIAGALIAAEIDRLQREGTADD